MYRYGYDRCTLSIFSRRLTHNITADIVLSLTSYSSHQTPPKHPIIIDFFAWPSLRSRLLSHYSLLSRSAALSFYYLSCLRFDWPFAFEDAFFHNKDTGSYLPSPLFETYSCNLKHWMMEETFYENFPEMRGDIEGDRVLYAYVDV